MKEVFNRTTSTFSTVKYFSWYIGIDESGTTSSHAQIRNTCKITSNAKLASDWFDKGLTVLVTGEQSWAQLYKTDYISRLVSDGSQPLKSLAGVPIRKITSKDQIE